MSTVINRILRGAAAGVVFFGSMAYFNGKATKTKRTKEVEEAAERFEQNTGIDASSSCVSRYAILAPLYDQRVDVEEIKSDILHHRKSLLSLAYGDVLEVAAGTARSLPYYVPGRVNSLLCVDDADEMIKIGVEKAKQKMDKNLVHSMQPRIVTAEEATDLARSNSSKLSLKQGESASRSPPPLPERNIHKSTFGILKAKFFPTTQNDPSVPESHIEHTPFGIPELYIPTYPVYFSAMNAQDLKPLPDSSFDTVVDSFGLCSFSNPSAALREMSRVCKPDGRILLYEHGRSPGFGLLNWYLDLTEVDHRKEWGCTHNRPIKDIVTRSGLEIERYENFDSGTMHIIVAKPKKDNTGSQSDRSLNNDNQVVKSI